MKRGIAALLMLLAVCTVAVAAEGPSLERGKYLFENDKLGTSGKSCASCHPGGKKLEWAATFEEERLIRTVNECITKPLRGKPLDPESDDMRSLIMYIRTFAGPGR